jgi:uncharacterized protein
VQRLTPLHETWGDNRAEMAKLLLERGADPNIAEAWYGYTVLHFAAYKGAAELTDVLLSANASVDARDRHGRTPLHVAVSAGHVAEVERLLAGGADRAAVDELGQTAARVANGAELRSLLSK